MGQDKATPWEILLNGRDAARCMVPLQGLQRPPEAAKPWERSMGLEMDGKQPHGQRAGISARAEAKLRLWADHQNIGGFVIGWK